MVVPAPIEADLRLYLGTVLLDYSENSKEALDQLQKAYHLSLHSAGSVGWERRCRIVRALVDALVRTEALNLAHSVVDRMILDCLKTAPVTEAVEQSVWQWCVHFSMISLQMKLERGSSSLQQVLTDLDQLLHLIQGKISAAVCGSRYQHDLQESLVLFLCVLVMVLMRERSIESVYRTLPAAISELRTAAKSVQHSGLLILSSMLLYLHSTAMGDFAAMTEDLAAMRAASTVFSADASLAVLPFIRLPGHLIYVSAAELQLLVQFLGLLHMRLDASVPHAELSESLGQLEAQLPGESEGAFMRELRVAVDAFRRCVGLATSGPVERFPQTVPSRMHEMLLLLTAHGLFGRFGREKVAQFYAQKMGGFGAVDSRAFMQLNASLATGAVAECDAAVMDASWMGALQHVAEAVRLQAQGAPAHQQRAHLDAAQGAGTCDPQLGAAVHLLRAELASATDRAGAAQEARHARDICVGRLGNGRWADAAARLLAVLEE